MLDVAVENVVMDLLAPHLPPGTVVRHALTAPADDETVEGLVVKASLEKVESLWTTCYVFRVTLEYRSMAPTGDLAKGAAVLDAVEAALRLPAPDPPPASLSAFAFFALHGNPAFDQVGHSLSGDRREQLRAFSISCLPA